MTDPVSIAQSDVNNRRRAYFAMCEIGLLALSMSLLTSLFSELIVYLDVTYARTLERAIVNLLVNRLGFDRMDSVTAAKSLFTSGAMNSLLSMIGSMLFMFLPAYIYSRTKGRGVSECFPTDGRFVGGIVGMFAVSQMFMMSSSAISLLFYGFLFPDIVYTPSASVASSDSFSMFMSFLHICVFVPFIEEYVFRGVVFTRLREYGIGFAAVASAAVFGMMHTSPVQSVYAMTFGLFSAMLFAVTGNIKTSVLFHALNNFIMFCQSFIPLRFGKTAELVSLSLYPIFIYIVGIYGLYRFLSKGGLLVRFRAVCQASAGERRVYPGIKELISITVIAYVLYYAYTFLTSVLS